jgi:predicted acetyltransferase
LVSGQHVIGQSSLRHHLNPSLEREGGHIGYNIRPSERRKGFGTMILSLTLEKAKGIGLTRVFVTCDTDNVASARIIEKNGGRLQGQVISERSGKLINQYWIEP